MKLDGKVKTLIVLFLLGCAFSTVPALTHTVMDYSKSLVEAFPESVKSHEKSGFTSSMMMKHANSSETYNRSTYVGGEMVELYHEDNYTRLDVVVWTTYGAVEEILSNSSQYSVSLVEFHDAFQRELEGCFAAAILGPVSDGMTQEEREHVAQEIIDWVTEGNLLIISDVGLMATHLRDELGVVDITELSTVDDRIVEFLPTTALVENLVTTQILAEEVFHGFILAEESRKRGHAAYGESGDEHGQERNRRFFTQSSHTHEVLLAPHCVNDTSSSKKEEGFKKGMGH